MLLLIISLLRWAVFMEGMFTMASSAVKKLPWKNRFLLTLPLYHEYPFLQPSHSKGGQSYSGHYRFGYFIRWIAQPLSSPHRTIWSTKWALHQGMSEINCIVTVSFARSQYVKLIPSKSFANVGYLISKDLICCLRIQYHASGRWSDGSEANIAVMVECCEFVSTASFSWSILYTIAASRVSFSWIVSLSQDSSKINLRYSQLLTLCSSLSFLV